MTTKYVIIIPDGAADDPLEQFGNKTVLEAANKPNMDKISQAGRLGIVRTVPEGMDPGSDVAQMSLLGYDPRKYYTGRAPIEAVARNVQLGPDDWVFRCNLVTFADNKMADHSAGHISTEEGAKLINECQGLTVLADSLLRQLFYNLIDNTLKYGRKVGRIRVHYREEGNQLKLIYEDDGVGIPDDVKSRLFQEGYGQGTGYGLYLIKRICEAYGWTIQETGKPGQGAQFIMEIPKNGKDGKRNYEIS